jgi:hypothetical protein
MKGPIDLLEAQLKSRRDYDSPPLHLWHPPLSGDISIVIDAQGEWHHDGTRIQRSSLVRLFASILRREDDGDYYLVTPGEKWRIQVELHPLMVTDVTALEIDGECVLEATLNTGRQIMVSKENPLFLEPAVGNIAALQLAHGLTALCTRSAWYRLVDMAESREGELTPVSGDFTLVLLID